MSVASLYTPCFVMFCVFLYGQFCHGAHKLDLSTLFTTFFLWTSLPFIFWFIEQFIFTQQCKYNMYKCLQLHNEGIYQSLDSLWQCIHPNFITNSPNTHTLRCRVVNQTERHQLQLLLPQHCPPPTRGEVQQLECAGPRVCHQDLAFTHSCQAIWFTRWWKFEGM